MQIIVLADAVQQAAFANNVQPNSSVVFVRNENELLAHKGADAFIDLAFKNDDGRKALLRQLLPTPVIINSVVDTLAETDASFVRINGWPAFLSSSLIEATCNSGDVKQKAEAVFSVFNRKIEWLQDEPGFVTARVVSMIVNEACLALSEGVSTREEMNTAMKLGTAYPYGPFEWAEKIGVQNIVTLLTKLSETQLRYQPSGLLVQETNNER